MRHEFVLPWLVRDHYVPGGKPGIKITERRVFDERQNSNDTGTAYPDTR